jgi:hypothetical protein
MDRALLLSDRKKERVEQITEATYLHVYQRATQDLPTTAGSQGARDRLARLSPSAALPKNWRSEEAVWEALWANGLTGEAASNAIGEILKVAACTDDDPPYAARALMQSGRLDDLGPAGSRILDALRDPKECPGATGLTPEDWSAGESDTK